MPTSLQPIVAVDIGNSRIKIGEFARENLAALEAGRLPEPQTTQEFATADWSGGQVGNWLQQRQPAEFRWIIGSVHRGAWQQWIEWLAEQAVTPADVRLLDLHDLPLQVDVAAPEKVGIDRLLAAVAANALRAAGQPAITVDVGSAITVDLIDERGHFRGGAILAGIGMSARALHEFTDLLPRMDLSILDVPPPPVGGDTQSAIRSGLLWGAIGSIRELVNRFRRELPREPLVLLTGGAAPRVIDLLAEGPAAIQARHEPHLVLAGTVLAAGAGKQ